MRTPNPSPRLVRLAVYLNSDDCNMWAQVIMGGLCGAACMLCLLAAMGWGPP